MFLNFRSDILKGISFIVLSFLCFAKVSLSLEILISGENR